MPPPRTAVGVLRTLPRNLQGDVLPGITTEAVTRSCKEAIRTAGVGDQHFLDLLSRGHDAKLERLPRYVSLSAVAV